MFYKFNIFEITSGVPSQNVFTGKYDDHGALWLHN